MLKNLLRVEIGSPKVRIHFAAAATRHNAFTIDHDNTTTSPEVSMLQHKAVAFALSIIVFASSISCQEDSAGNIVNPPIVRQWQQAADFAGQPVRGSGAFSIGANAYVVSGLVDGAGLVPDVWQYNSATNSWTRKGNFPGIPRLDMCGFSIGTKGYICLGSDNVGYLSDIWEYDSQNDLWTQRGDFPGRGRLLATALVLGQKAYIVAGANASGSERDVWEFDPQANKWTQKKDFPGGARASAAGFVVGDKGYLGTGIVPPGLTLVRDFWEYDPQNDQWTRKADFPGVARAYAQGFSLGSKGYVGLGLLAVAEGGSSVTLTKDLWEYDASDTTWTRMQDIPASGRSMAVCFAVGTWGFVGLGNNERIVNLLDLWKFAP